MSVAKKIYLRNGEEILEHLRRYSLTCLHLYLLGLVILAIAFFFITWLFSQGPWGVGLFGLAILGGLYIIFRTWFFAHANVLVVTNERVVDIARNSWFDEIVSSVSYADITDISSRRRGVLPRLFDYGNIVFQTQSQKFILEASRIYQPQKVVNFILEQIEFRKNGKAGLTVEEIYRKFIKVIPELTDQELIHIDELVQDELDAIEEEVEVLEEITDISLCPKTE